MQKSGVFFPLLNTLHVAYVFRLTRDFVLPLPFMFINRRIYREYEKAKNQFLVVNLFVFCLVFFLVDLIFVCVCGLYKL